MEKTMAQAPAETVRPDAQNMICPVCPITVKSLLEQLSGVSTVKVNFAEKMAMPTDACQFLYECVSCKTLLRPNSGDCCVFCSFGTVTVVRG
jgi:copper chaperone CopZ